MARRILITGVCQTGGVAAALAQVFPEDTITALGFSDFLAQDNCVQRIKEFDFWVTTEGYYLFDEVLNGRETVTTQLIKYPALVFAGFHPDLTYLWNITSNEVYSPHYNSKIVVWAFLRGLSVEETATLFQADVYQKLGYFDKWSGDVKALSAVFEACGLDYRRFFLHMKRQGVFMNTINHPRPETLIQLARVIALKMGATLEEVSIPISIIDSLQSVVWPVYPAIADSIGVPGSLNWVLGRPVVGGLKGFISEMFSIYKAQDLKPGSVAFLGDQGGSCLIDEYFDDILQPFIDRSQ